MRLYLILLLMGALAVRALPTGAENGAYALVGIGGEACARSSAEHAGRADLPYGLWPMGPVDALCNLDRALLSLQKYFGSQELSAAETLPTGVRPGRLQTRFGR